MKRVLFVGGAGSLEVAPGQQLVDQPGFPEAYKAEALEGREALEVWRTEGGGLDWSFLSPAAEIAPGERTGRYPTTGDQLLVDASGRSFITFEDYAVAVLDELEQAIACCPASSRSRAVGSVQPTDAVQTMTANRKEAAKP